VLNFNLHLPPVSSETVDLRALICQGVLPQTDAPATGFPMCSSQLPQGNLPPSLIAHTPAATTGHPSAVYFGMCGGADFGDNVARGYVTVDAVNDCTLQFPSDPGYAGSLDMQNQLQGSFRVVDPGRALDLTATAVSLEADPMSFGPGSATFYERYTGSLDAREPLPAVVTAPYDLTFAVDTQLFLWRDGLDPNPFPCGSPPAPLSDADVLVAADDTPPTETLASPASFEANAFDFSGLGAAAGADGSSSGDVTFTLPSQAWVLSSGIDRQLDTNGIPDLSPVGFLLFFIAIAAAALRRL
jgi:hypothetical protein